MVPRKPRVTSCAVATGTTISALTSSRPTARMATVTVTAVVTASSRFSARTGRPETRAYSSSWQTANSHGRSPQRDRQHAAPSTAITTRSAADVVSSEPNRYDDQVGVAALPESPTRNTPPAMPP